MSQRLHRMWRFWSSFLAPWKRQESCVDTFNNLVEGRWGTIPLNMERILRVAFLKLIIRTLLMTVVRYFSNTGTTLIFIAQHIRLIMSMKGRDWVGTGSRLPIHMRGHFLLISKICLPDQLWWISLLSKLLFEVKVKNCLISCLRIINGLSCEK
jgi:hypothetical protein